MGPDIMVDPDTALGTTAALIVIPIVGLLAVTAFLTITSIGLARTNRVAAEAHAARRRREVATHAAENIRAAGGVRETEPAHEVAGGFYQYRPGMYSHSYSPEEVAAMDAQAKKEAQRA